MNSKLILQRTQSLVANFCKFFAQKNEIKLPILARTKSLGLLGATFDFYFIFAHLGTF